MDPVNNLANNDPALRALNDMTLVNLTNLKSPAFQKVKAAAKKTSVTQKGKDQNLITEARTIIKAGASNMDYPRGTTFRKARYHVYTTDHFITYEIDRGTYEDYTNRKPDTAQQITDELSALAEAYGEQQEIMLWGDGSGKLALTGAPVSTTVLQLSISGAGHRAEFGVYNLKSGVPYDLYSNADAFIATVEITEGGINYASNQITLTAALGAAPAAGAFLVPAGSYYEFFKGLAYLVQGQRTGVFQGINVTGKPNFSSSATDCAGSNLSSNLLDKLHDKVAFVVREGSHMTQKLWTSPTQVALYKAQGYTLFRYGVNDTPFNMSFKGARFEDEIFEAFPQSDPNRVYYTDPGKFEYLEQTPVGIMDADGLRFRQKEGTGTGMGEFYLNYGGAFNFLVDDPQHHGLLYNLLTTGAATPANYLTTS